MSPDDIFAAQFWTWPDPAVKRDATGRVMFVNAAFLQLYGGQAQDWHGNAVSGWPAPQGAGQAFRFETRVPGHASTGEQVYDWIEMTLPDGSAFCLARNVTAFLQAPDPQPGHTAPVPDHDDATVSPPQTTETQAPISEYASLQTESEPVASTASILSDQLSSPATETPMEQVEATPQVEHIVSQAPEQVVAEPEMPATPFAEEMPPAADVADSSSQDLPPLNDLIETSDTQGAPETDPEAERAIERRALPIESDSAVLGNNWRDAVIAKAVGAEAPTEETEVEAPAPAPAAITSDNAGGPVRILLAEDNAINALLTRTLLEAEGHTVDTVEDGQLAVEAMKSAAYDLIFMDMRMPNMDGLEATRKIRMLPNVSKDLPIIALTANAFDDDRNACFDSGMNDFMTKPVSAEELSEMVTNWTSGQRQQLAS